MSSDYERPRGDPDASACSYTEYETTDHVEGDVPATGEGATGLERDVWAALYSVEDPEMPVSIVDLGLIYDLDVENEIAHIEMTLTYSGCPAREIIFEEIEHAVETVAGIDEAEIRLVWAPDWSMEMVTEQGKEALREFGLSFEQ